MIFNKNKMNTWETALSDSDLDLEAILDEHTQLPWLRGEDSSWQESIQQEPDQPDEIEIHYTHFNPIKSDQKENINPN